MSMTEKLKSQIAGKYGEKMEFLARKLTRGRNVSRIRIVETGVFD